MRIASPAGRSWRVTGAELPVYQKLSAAALTLYLQPEGESSKLGYMLKRFLVVLCAILVAGLVLLMSILVEQPVGSRPEPGPVEYDTLDNIPTPLADESPFTGDIKRQQPFKNIQRGIHRFNDDPLTVLTYQRLDPKPQGVLDVIEPVARIYVQPHQVLEIRSDDATIIAPDNQPRSGAFHHDVVLSLFTGEHGGQIDFENDERVDLRVFLDHANFDMELGLIESLGPVRLTGPDVDFYGSGLSLEYNQLRHRIQHLEVFRGRSLRFKPQRTRREYAGDTAPRDHDNSHRSGPRIKNESTLHGEAPTESVVVDGEAPASDSADGSSDRQSQYYLARFLNRVHVHDARGRIEMHADILEVVFQLPDGSSADDSGREAGTLTDLRLHQADASACPSENMTFMLAPGRPLYHAVQAILAGVFAATQTADDKSLMSYGPEDLIVEWTGRLMIDPVISPPTELDGPDDMQVRLVGLTQPVRIRTWRDETIEAAEVEYTSGIERFRASASELIPMTIESPRMGRLSARHIEVDQNRRRVTVLGPGIVHESDDLDSTHSHDQRALPAGLQIEWSEQLDLTFYDRSDIVVDDDATEPDGFDRMNQLGDLRTAVFNGDVIARHDMFDLNAVQLAITFDDPRTGGSDKPQFIDALGDVLVSARGRLPEENITIQSQQLNMVFAGDVSDDGRSPVMLTAERDVVAWQKGLTLWAQSMEVIAADEPDESAGAAHENTDAHHEVVTAAEVDQLVNTAVSPDSVDTTTAHTQINQTAAVTLADTDKPQDPTVPLDENARDVTDVQTGFQIRAIHAAEDVYVQLDEHNVDLAGDRMAVDLDAGRLELFGTGRGGEACLIRPDGTIMGRQLVLNRNDSSVHVSGQGRLVMQLQPDRDNQNDGDTSPGVTELAADWADAMNYDHQTGVAVLAGNVRCATRSPSELTSLTCGNLILEFDDMAVDDGGNQAEITGPGEPGSDVLSKRSGRAGQSLKKLTARDKVVFEGRAVNDTDDPDDALRRLHLEGPVMTFDRSSQQLKVTGTGRMLVEDYPPAGREEADDDYSPLYRPVDRPVQFSGRGATLFLWDGRLTLDASNNDMLIERAVQMIHRPPTEAGRPAAIVQLDCRSLLADLDETGGLSGWQTGDEDGRTEIKIIQADHAVRLIHDDRTVNTDHLRYNASDREVYLWSEPGGQVSISEDDRLIDIRAEKVKWNLETDRIEALHFTGGTVPLQ